MTREEIIKFLNANVACFLATTEDGEPRVRGMALYRADDEGILFHTGAFKDISAQLKANPKAEICAFDHQAGVQVRVRGDVEFIDDMDLKNEVIAGRPFLKPFVDASGYDSLILFRIKNCRATVWTMQTNLEPKTWTKL